MILVKLYYNSNSTGTVHTFAKAYPSSITIQIHIWIKLDKYGSASGSLTRIATKIIIRALACCQPSLKI